MRSAGLVLVFGLAAAATALGGTVEVTFTPERVLIPARKILLKDDIGNHEAVWTCPAADGGCLFELGNAPAVAALLAAGAAPVPAATYRQAIVEKACTGPGGQETYTAWVKGRVTFDGGATLYTSGGPRPLSADPDAGYAAVVARDCGALARLAAPLTVDAGAAVHLSLYYSLESAAFAVVVGPDAGTVGVGLYETQLYAVPGRHAPKVERYFLTRDLEDDAGTTVSNLFLFFFDEADELIGGTGRRFFSETAGPSVVIADSVFLVLQKTADGGLSFADTGGADWTYRFDDFPRRDHVGTVAEPAGTRPYRAFRR